MPNGVGILILVLMLKQEIVTKQASILIQKSKPKIKRNRYIVKAEYNYSDDEDQITVDDRALEGIYDYFFKPKWFFNSAIKLEQDKIEELDLRTKVTLGLGHQPFESKNLNIKYTLGPTYLHEEYENRDTDDNIAVLWAFDYNQRFFANAFQLFHDHSFTLPTDDTDAFLFDSQSGIKIPISCWNHWNSRS